MILGKVDWWSLGGGFGHFGVSHFQVQVTRGKRVDGVGEMKRFD